MTRWRSLERFLLLGMVGIVTMVHASDTIEPLPPAAATEDLPKIPTLLTRNPFMALSKPEEKRPAVENLRELKELEQVVEYRGSFQVSGDRRFSLFFKEVSQRRWVGKEESLYGIKIIDALEDGQVLVVDHQGTRGHLKLKTRGQQGSLARRDAQPPSNQRQVNPARMPMSREGLLPPSRDVPPPRMMPQRIPKPEGMGAPPQSQDFPPSRPVPV